eukprot:1159844-Pelagomonas_calceolata.AAC.6
MYYFINICFLRDPDQDLLILLLPDVTSRAENTELGNSFEVGPGTTWGALLCPSLSLPPILSSKLSAA